MCVVRKLCLILVVVALISFAEGYAIAEEDAKININTATVDELMPLKGIGLKKADAIIAYRDKKGSFNKEEEIKNVKGIGDKIFEGIKNLITVGKE